MKAILQYSGQLLVFVTLLFSSLPSFAQPLGFEGEVVDSQVVELLGGLELTDLVPGLEVTRFENRPLVDDWIAPENSYDFTLIRWQSPRTETQAGTELRIVIGFFSDTEELPGAWRAVNSTRSVGGQQLDIGDAARGLYPSTVSFVKNGFVGSIKVSTYVSEDGDVGERLFEQVKDRLFAVIEAQGDPPTPGLDVSFQVLSDSEPLVVAVDTGTSPFRHSIGYSIGSSVEPYLVDSQEHELLTEENRTVTVSGLPPGDYKLSISVNDDLYRSENFLHAFTVSDPSSPPDDPTSDSLPATKDTTIYDRGPHKNEGANPRLLLKKVQGKPAHFLVGFETTGVSANGLTKASLVLTIDSSQNVTGWGNGRPIRARRVLTDWAEGNGKGLELPGNQQTSGAGAGATWFSPVDTNISNSQADSAVAWSGAISHTAPSTAPMVTVKNHQSGEVIFDVTEDLLLGASHGWLITRDQDVGSQVAFYSREAGSELGPRLVLEYGPGLAQAPGSRLLGLMHSFRMRPLSTTGNLARGAAERVEGILAYLDTEPIVTESGRPGLASALLVPQEDLEAAGVQAVEARQNTALSWAGEELARTLAGPNPALSALGRLAYRAALEAV